ncbi:hypothetical protein QBC47DRAFT_403554 [Echria macrotheca]|uniref:Uncharacterized protein n=1 Tax=Echria macrotheca TaxID=438768 RepID=A0AAJ0F556_9PEZI|nr:hypothetical protein QBC47DRAFT_403554 [Echria macrotheca]
MPPAAQISNTHAFNPTGVQPTVNRQRTSLCTVPARRSRQEDPLGYDLMIAAQYIASARQGLTSLYGALNESISARNSLERTSVPTQRKLETLTAEYDNLHQYCRDIHQRYKTLQDQYNCVTADLEKAKAGQVELQTTKAELQKTKTELEELRVLRETVEVELQRTQNELTALSDWRTQECREYNSIIETLRQSVQERDTKLTAMEGDLERELKYALRAIQDNQAAEAEVSKLKDIIATYELRIRDLEGQNLRAEEEVMRKVQLGDPLEDENARKNIQLQSEVESLKKSLSDAEEARKRLEADETRFRDENASLSQQLGVVKEVLAVRFPEIDIDGDLGNLSSIIDKNLGARGKKRRRCGK